jgi:hypothetical protein
MTTRINLMLATLLMFGTFANAQPTTAPSEDASALADQVMKASGSDVWPKVTRIKWTFAGRRQHDWDVKNMTDKVTTNGKSVTVNIMNPGDDKDSKAAFGAWTNDSYWLLAPLKIKDKGVTLTKKEPAEIEGAKYDVLHLSFAGVGMTPGDQYNMYIDPETHLVRWWDYIPKSGQQRRMSWDGYKDYNGLMLASEHKMGPPISDIDVTVQK